MVKSLAALACPQMDMQVLELEVSVCKGAPHCSSSCLPGSRAGRGGMDTSRVCYKLRLGIIKEFKKILLGTLMTL